MALFEETPAFYMVPRSIPADSWPLHAPYIVLRLFLDVFCGSTESLRSLGEGGGGSAIGPLRAAILIFFE
jgi:hypothetical protein